MFRGKSDWKVLRIDRQIASLPTHDNSDKIVDLLRDNRNLYVESGYDMDIWETRLFTATVQDLAIKNTSNSNISLITGDIQHILLETDDKIILENDDVLQKQNEPEFSTSAVIARDISWFDSHDKKEQLCITFENLHHYELKVLEAQMLSHGGRTPDGSVLIATTEQCNDLSWMSTELRALYDMLTSFSASRYKYFTRLIGIGIVYPEPELRYDFFEEENARAVAEMTREELEATKDFIRRKYVCRVTEMYTEKDEHFVEEMETACEMLDFTINNL